MGGREGLPRNGKKGEEGEGGGKKGGPRGIPEGGRSFLRFLGDVVRIVDTGAASEPRKFSRSSPLFFSFSPPLFDGYG